MKKIIGIGAILLLLVGLGCRDMRDCSPRTDINGEWIWVETYGGVVGWTTTPQTENMTQKIIIDDPVFEQYRNDTLISTQSFQIMISGSDTLIQFDDGNQQYLKLRAQELILSDLCADCFTHRYRCK